MKLWAGRFSSSADRRLDDFNASIAFDSRMVAQDIRGSIAHAAMLGQTGIIQKSEADILVEGLKKLLVDLESGLVEIDPTCEDIHTFVEATLTERLGDVGKRLHTARSRNDQVATDLRLYLRDEAAEVRAQLIELCTTLCELAKKHAGTVMPGYTHLQRAQPITFGHQLMAYTAMLLRDIKRIDNAQENMNECPLGCGALAGTTYPIDRHATAKDLGFLAPCQNSLDGVSDRDFCIELCAALSTIMVHLSRFSEEIILWCSYEFKFIELDDAFSTGSSIMPQKKNPDIAELVRGKSGRVFGDLMGLLTLLKGLPLAYNKDMQEDKEAIFDAFDTVKMCLSAFTPMVATMKVRTEEMRRAAADGFINATDCADYLVKKGMPFRDAYKIVGQLVARCIAEGTNLESLTLKAYNEYTELFTQDVYEAINMERCAGERSSFGGTSPESVLAQVAQAEQVLKNC